MSRKGPQSIVLRSTYPQDIGGSFLLPDDNFPPEPIRCQPVKCRKYDSNTLIFSRFYIIKPYFPQEGRGHSVSAYLTSALRARNSRESTYCPLWNKNLLSALAGAEIRIRLLLLFHSPSWWTTLNTNLPSTGQAFSSQSTFRCAHGQALQ